MKLLRRYFYEIRGWEGFVKKGLTCEGRGRMDQNWLSQGRHSGSPAEGPCPFLTPQVTLNPYPVPNLNIPNCYYCQYLQ
jgi:hypothetical protein